MAGELFEDPSKDEEWMNINRKMDCDPYPNRRKLLHPEGELNCSNFGDCLPRGMATDYSGQSPNEEMAELFALCMTTSEHLIAEACVDPILKENLEVIIRRIREYLNPQLGYADDMRIMCSAMNLGPLENTKLFPLS